MNEEKYEQLEKENSLYKIAIRDFGILMNFELEAERSIEKYTPGSNFQLGVLDGMRTIQKNWEEVVEKLNKNI